MRNAILFLAIALFGLSSCQQDFGPANGGNGDILERWVDTDVALNKRILNAHGGAEELLLISTTEFFRVGNSFNIIEKRNIDDLIFGRPVLSDFTYAYMKKDGNFKDVVSFHLVNNPDEVLEISADDLAAESGQTIIFETQTRTPGVFNDDGTQFALPALVFPDFNYHFYIFDIKLNPQKTLIQDISLAREVIAEEMPADFGSLTNMRLSLIHI